MIRVMRVLTNLHDTEESIAVEAQLAVDLCVNLERHAPTRLLKLAIFHLQGLILLIRGRIVDPGIQDGPTLARCRTFEVPVAKDVCVGLAVADCIVSWYYAAFHAEIYTKE